MGLTEDDTSDLDALLSPDVPTPDFLVRSEALARGQQVNQALGTQLFQREIDGSGLLPQSRAVIELIEDDSEFDSEAALLSVEAPSPKLVQQAATLRRNIEEEEAARAGLRRRDGAGGGASAPLDSVSDVEFDSEAALLSVEAPTRELTQQAENLKRKIAEEEAAREALNRREDASILLDGAPSSKLEHDAANLRRQMEETRRLQDQLSKANEIKPTGGIRGFFGSLFGSRK